MSGLRDHAAIAGIGATDFSRDSGRSEMQLAAEATLAALDDAGVAPADVDGLCSYTMDHNLEVELFRNIGGRELKFFSRIGYGGGGACAPLQQAAMAVATGVAEAVVCYRAMNERSQYRFGTPFSATMATGEGAMIDFHAAHGLQTAAAMMAIGMRRYMHDHGVLAEDFAPVSIAARRHAASNPKAFFYGKPITRTDYLASKMIASPLRLLDCCQESDGAVAVLVTSPARAATLRQPRVLIRAAAQGAPWGTMGMTNFYRDDITPFPEVEVVARQLYAQAGLTPAQIDVAIIYDHFGPSVLPSLEAYGFCARGEAKDFIKDGNIEVGGSLPVNTHGGQLGEAYIHGMNGVAEAVRQLRGTAVNQVSNVEHVLVTAGSAVPTSGAILARG